MIIGSKMRCRQVQTAGKKLFNIATFNFCSFHMYWKHSQKLKMEMRHDSCGLLQRCSGVTKFKPAENKASNHVCGK